MRMILGFVVKQSARRLGIATSETEFPRCVWFESETESLLPAHVDPFLQLIDPHFSKKNSVDRVEDDIDAMGVDMDHFGNP